MIPFIDLAAQQARIRPQVDEAIARVLSHGKYIMGPEVAELEDKLCDFVGSRHCITMSNGTDALVAALMALGIGPGDGVITTPFTFFATVESILFVGATPIFADIDPATFNICPQAIERAILERQGGQVQLKAIMPVDLFGLAADYASINRLAEEHNLAVIQDSAQGFGAKTPDWAAGADTRIDWHLQLFSGQAAGVLRRRGSLFYGRRRIGNPLAFDTGAWQRRRQVRQRPRGPKLPPGHHPGGNIAAETSDIRR